MEDMLDGLNNEVHPGVFSGIIENHILNFRECVYGFMKKKIYSKGSVIISKNNSS